MFVEYSSLAIGILFAAAAVIFDNISEGVIGTCSLAVKCPLQVFQAGISFIIIILMIIIIGIMIFKLN